MRLIACAMPPSSRDHIAPVVLRPLSRGNLLRMPCLLIFGLRVAVKEEKCRSIHAELEAGHLEEPQVLLRDPREERRSRRWLGELAGLSGHWGAVRAHSGSHRHHAGAVRPLSQASRWKL